MAELALTVKETAEALGLSTRTVYEMVYQRKIPFRRIGFGKRGQGKILIPRAALEKWLMEGEEKPKARLRAVR